MIIVDLFSFFKPSVLHVLIKIAYTSHLIGAGHALRLMLHVSFMVLSEPTARIQQRDRLARKIYAKMCRKCPYFLLRIFGLREQIHFVENGIYIESTSKVTRIIS